MGIQLGQLVAGAIVLESVFALPGSGGSRSAPSARATCPSCRA